MIDVCEKTNRVLFLASARHTLEVKTKISSTTTVPSMLESHKNTAVIAMNMDSRERCTQTGLVCSSRSILCLAKATTPVDGREIYAYHHHSPAVSCA